MTALEVAQAYQNHINAGDADALLGLFADGAELLHPVGEFRGVAEIRAFYEAYVLPFHIRMDAMSWVHDEDRCVFEIEARAEPGGPATYAIDHMTVEGGGIVRLAVYYRR
jgi:hypothetical protein